MFKKWLKNDNLLVSYRMTGATMLQYFSRRRKSIPRGIHVLARSLHVFPKYGCDELVQLWTAMHGFLACMRSHATTIPASAADIKGSPCISDAIRWVRPVSDSYIGPSLVSALRLSQLARPLFWTRYIDKSSWVAMWYRCSTLRVLVLLVSQRTSRSA